MDRQCNYLGFGVTTAVAMILASLLAKIWYPFAAWFRGGPAIGLGAQLFLNPPDKRKPARTVLATVATGIVGASVVFLFEHVPG